MIRAPDKNKKPSPKPQPSPKPMPKERNFPDAPGTGLFIIQKNGSYYHDTGGIAGGRFLTKDEYNKLIAQDPNISNFTVTEDQYRKGDYKLPPGPKPLPFPRRTTPPPIDFPPYDRPIPRGEPIPPPYRDFPPYNDFPPYDRSIPRGEPIPQQPKSTPPYRDFPPYDVAMAQQAYANLIQQQIANATAQGRQVFPQPVGQIAQLTQPTPAIRPIQQNQQAIQNYQNLVGQGIANMQAMGTATPTIQPQAQPRRNISTQSFQTPRPFG